MTLFMRAQLEKFSKRLIEIVRFLADYTIIKDLNGYEPLMLDGIPLLSWIFGFCGGILLYISISGKR